MMLRFLTSFTSIALCTTCLLPNALSGQAVAKEGLLPTDGLPVVSWEEAGQVVGRRAVVYGKIVDVGSTTGISFLNFDTNKRNQKDFTGVVFGKSDAAFQERFKGKSYEDLYLNKNVTIHGTVALFKGAPQIIIASPDQINIVDELPGSKMVELADIKIGNELRIGSYNIENLFDSNDDPYHNDEGTSPKPREDMEKVARVIKEINLDVIAFQEVESRGYLQQFVYAMLPEMGYKHVVHYEGNDGRGIDVCLISRIPIGEVTSHRHHVFKAHDGKDQKFGRDLLRVELLPEGGDPFEMWIVHLKSNSGGKELNEPIRLGECREVHRLIARRLREKPDTSLILCGDFNDEFETKTIQTILGDPPILKTIFDNIPKAERVTYNRKPYRSMIDFMLCSPAMADRLVPGSFGIRFGTDEESGSDHNPIYARFKKGTASQDVTTTTNETASMQKATATQSTSAGGETATSSISPTVPTHTGPATPSGTKKSYLKMGILGLGVLGALAIGTLLVNKAS